MQIFRNMLMLHTEKGVVAGWCGLNAKDGGTEAQVFVQGAPQGQLEVMLVTGADTHKLGVMDVSGKSAKKNFFYKGKAGDVQGVRIAHMSVHYILEGGQTGKNAPVAAGKGAPKARAVMAQKVAQPKQEVPKAVPIPVENEPVPPKMVMQNQAIPIMTQGSTPQAASAGKANAPIAQCDMRLATGPQQAQTENIAGQGLADNAGNMDANVPAMDPAGGKNLAQTDMRLQGKTENDHIIRKGQKPPFAPAAPGTAAPDARIQALMDKAQPPENEALLSEPPLPLAGMPEQAPNKKGGQMSPELIEVLALSDMSNSGVEQGLLGEGSGRQGLLGKGVWWRVEQPGVQDWHYLAGELTARDGRRVRAIALKDECGALPDHLEGWAQKAEDYFIVLIDVKTGTMLPETAC